MMRCIACGGEMILTAVTPDDAGMVAGFRHETLHCSVCRDTEHRFVYSRDEKTERPLISALPQKDVISSTSHETISSSPPHSSMPQCIVASPPQSFREAIASVTSWGRAVEKLRKRQADIKMRAGAGKIEKADWNAQVNQSGFGPPLQNSPLARDATSSGQKHFVRKSARVLRTELCGSSSVGKQLKQPTIEPPRTSIEQFNRLWDSLLPASPDSELVPEASATSAKPLPRSLSLVQVENLEGMSVAGHAILLLRREALGIR